ncbi:MAG: sulfite reductase subunit alpha [Chthoniobacteraceae bacterium]
MTAIPFIPENAPFTAEQRQWLNGYLAGLLTNAASAPEPAAPKRPLLVLYGSQTGTSEALAKKTAKVADAKGFAPRLVCMEKFESVDLAKEEHVLVITSTYGDGEPPDNAIGFWAWLSSDSAPRLEQTRFSVLALGDTNYAQFCEFGKRCDARLEQLGAQRLHARTDCDVDYDAPAAAWTESVFAAMGGISPMGPMAPTTEAHSRKNPFSARLTANRKLTRDGSGKEVRHFEIDLFGSDLSYEVGDALGVLPTNCPALVADVLAALGCDGEEAVGDVPLRLALAQTYDISRPSSDLLSAIAARDPSGELAPLLDPARRDDLKKFLWGREVIDLIAGLAQPFAPAEFVALLKKLQPRLYSISSSPNAHPGEVHLTVGAVRYESHGRARGGVCSTFLSDRVGTDTPVPVFVQPSHGFKLPTDAARDIIMVGPGTGIAPFRAFLEERELGNAAGRNWLFFGDQRRATDFLYEEQLTAWRESGHLARLDLAFSRDQAEKFYVQHRMIESAAELWSWLEGGAHFYVCGDASRMAKDVDAALHRACEIAGGLSAEAATEYVARLKTDKRYQRDVY